jgi:hypothetical protein
LTKSRKRKKKTTEIQEQDKDMPTMLREKDDAESTSRLFSRIDP